MRLETLEKQSILWTRLSVLVPIFVTIFLMLTYFFEITDVKTLFYIACGLYFTTAIIWWWWTMKSICFVIQILKNTKQDIKDVIKEVHSIQKDFTKDDKDNN